MESAIFTNEELSRISTGFENNTKYITVDVHGMSCHDALRFIRNIVALHFRDVFVLTVIHGYNGGTAIKETIRDNMISDRVKAVTSCAWNPGVTMFQVA